jgi:hypothetical protein
MELKRLSKKLLAEKKEKKTCTGNLSAVSTTK